MTLAQTSHSPLLVSAVSPPISNLFPDERHHADTCEHVLPGQALPWNAICKRFGAIGPRLTEVTHEKRHVGPGNAQANTFCTGERDLSNSNEMTKNQPQNVKTVKINAGYGYKRYPLRVPIASITFQFDSLELFLRLPS